MKRRRLIFHADDDRDPVRLLRYPNDRDRFICHAPLPPLVLPSDLDRQHPIDTSQPFDAWPHIRRNGMYPWRPTRQQLRRKAQTS